MNGVVARIICVGNRFVPGDDAGPRVYDYLAGRGLPAAVELVDGGLGGLNLLGRMEGVGRVVFVDSLRGFGGAGPTVLDGLAFASETEAEFGHSDGLAYLLKMLPRVWEGPLPEVLVVGGEGPADGPAVARLAAAALQAAAGAAPEEDRQRTES